MVSVENYWYVSSDSGPSTAEALNGGVQQTVIKVNDDKDDSKVCLSAGCVHTGETLNIF